PVGDMDSFLVEDTLVQAVPQDLEPAIAEGPERGMVPLAPCALQVVELTSPPGAQERAERPLLHSPAEVAVVREPARHDELGLGPHQVVLGPEVLPRRARPRPCRRSAPAVRAGTSGRTRRAPPWILLPGRSRSAIAPAGAGTSALRGPRRRSEPLRGRSRSGP